MTTRSKWEEKNMTPFGRVCVNGNGFNVLQYINSTESLFAFTPQYTEMVILDTK